MLGIKRVRLSLYCMNLCALIYMWSTSDVLWIAFSSFLKMSPLGTNKGMTVFSRYSKMKLNSLAFRKPQITCIWVVVVVVSALKQYAWWLCCATVLCTLCSHSEWLDVAWVAYPAPALAEKAGWPHRVAYNHSKWLWCYTRERVYAATWSSYAWHQVAAQRPLYLLLLLCKKARSHYEYSGTTLNIFEIIVMSLPQLLSC